MATVTHDLHHKDRIPDLVTIHKVGYGSAIIAVDVTIPSAVEYMAGFCFRDKLGHKFVKQFFDENVKEIQ